MDSYNSSKVEELVMMGFAYSDVEQAIRINGAGSDAALNWLLSKDQQNHNHYDQNTANSPSHDNNSQLQRPAHYELNAFEPLNPEERKRVEGTPVGLKNIGNTCYFNSLIQTYFMIPAFVKEIMNFRMPEEFKEENESKSNSYKLLSQLQKLFALMIGSNRKYIDPTPVLSSITDDFGNKIEIGGQRDVGEFNMILVSRIAEAMRRNDEIEEIETLRTTSGMMVSIDGSLSNMFYGRQTETILFNEEDGTRITQKNPVIFGQINLDIEYGDLLTAWEFSKSARIENFKTQTGTETTATQRVWVDKLPSILLFQIQRAAYDKEKKELMKINKRFDFPKILYVDRFLSKNKKAAKKQHTVVKRLRKQIKTLEETIDSITKYKNSGLSLPDILQLASTFVKEEHPEDGSQKEGILDKNTSQNQMLEVLPSWLEYLAKQCQESMEHKKFELEGLKKELEEQYNVPELMKIPYFLHSILVHEGSAEGGHYFTFIYDPEKDIWRKYNDINVTNISEEEVLQISYGGNGCGSAYSLVYIESKLKPAPKDSLYCSYTVLSDTPADDDYSSYLSPELIEEVKIHNLLETEQLAEFRATLALKDIQNLYVSRYTACESQYMSFDSLKDKSSGTIRHELINFSVYLRIKGETALCKWYILDSCLQAIYPEKGSLKDYDRNDPIYTKLSQFFIKSYKDAPQFIDLSSSYLKNLEKFKTQYKSIIKQAYIAWYVLKDFNDGNFINGMKSFVYEAQFPLNERTFYQETIRDALKVMILRLVSQIINDLESGEQVRAIDLIGHIVTITCFSLDKTDTHYKQVRNIIDSINDNRDKFKITGESAKKVKEFLQAINSGTASPSFDMMDFSQEFIELLADLEAFDTYAWRDGWAKAEIASRFLEQLNYFRSNLYEKWYKLHIKLTTGTQKPLSFKEYREIEKK